MGNDQDPNQTAPKSDSQPPPPTEATNPPQPPEADASDPNIKPQTTTNNRQIGHYIVGRSLGQGTFGKVRLGTHLLTGEKVAIKILEKDKIKDQSDVERVTREIHILKIVRHPNIIETSRQLFLIMEYANGGELFDYIVKRKRLQEPEAAKFFQQIISGVEYIHKVRICHRDLKPENLLLDDKQNIKIVDFGLSNMYKENELLKTACGSPCYAAPEMIAGKKYHGLNSDIWSCGIILYAMACGYLPFEDPNTNKLYKKILNCDYLIPGFISANCKEMIRKILNTDPITRFTVKDIKTHDWYNQVKLQELEGIIVGKDKIPIIEEAINKMSEQFGEDTMCQAATFIQNNKHNQVTSTYYLILKKMERDTGKNYVFEQVQRDKKRNANSVSNLSTVNFASPQTKLSAPAKIMMNQTQIGGFNRFGGPQSSAKSEGKTQRQDQLGGSNPQTKKYLEQMERIYTKRTESTSQTRPTDSMTNYQQQLMQERPTKSGNGYIDTVTNSLQNNHYQTQVGIRATQSQSPNSRVMNMAVNIQSNASANTTVNNQTFYMAERLKKNQGFNRPISIDENVGNMIIQSTNDSRVQDILPNVSRQNNKSVQMRSTMYNNPYLNKLNANKNLIVQPTVSNNKDQRQVNIVDQKKLDNSIMIMTQYNTQNTGMIPNANNQNNVNSTAISKALAQSKVRKYRTQNRNNESFNHEISHGEHKINGSVNETVVDRIESLINSNNNSILQKKIDSNLFTVYRAKKQQKINNRAEGIGGNQSFDYTQNNTNQSSLATNEATNLVNNSFTAGPNTTASRFYNPHKHNRFISNYNPNLKTGGNNIPIFQNNFVLPISFNTQNVTKTFYNTNASQGTKQNIQNQKPQSNSPRTGSVLEQNSHQSTATNSQTGYQQQVNGLQNKGGKIFWDKIKQSIELK